jgi:uncharacterized protein
MDAALLTSFVDPAILFFFFGLFAGAVRSNLEVPAPVAKCISLYLLISIGFKGGVALSHTGFGGDMVLALGAAMLLACVVPCVAFAVLRRRLGLFDAAAIAATYGSVSAVTFITATTYAERHGIPFGGYMAVALVVMESPAIVMAVLLANVARGGGAASTNAGPTPLGGILREAFTDGAHLLLLGSLVIGFVTGAEGKRMLDPFTGQIQKGLLSVFLLDMGLLVASRAGALRQHGRFLALFGLCAPLVNAVFAGMLARGLGLALGDAFLLVVLAASASYIVVPAVLRHAIPEANASLYFGLALVITFPFNIAFGIPLYHTVLGRLWT